MIEKLIDYALEHGLEAEPGFKPKEVRWAVILDEKLRFLDVIELGDAGAKRNRGQTFAKCPDLSQPEMKAGGAIKSHFLADTSEVVCLLGKDAQETKNLAKHRYFIDLLGQAGEAMPILKGIADCLVDELQLERIRGRLQDLGAKPTDKVTFRAGDLFVVDSDSWREWWRDFRRGLVGGEAKEAPSIGSGQGKATRKTRKPSEASEMRSFATGSLETPAKTHPKVEGLSGVGGLSTGDVLIGFDKDAFQSYNLNQSANAAMSEESANAYRAALNDLIKKHSQNLAGIKVVHWFKKMVPPEDDPLYWLEEAGDQQERNAQTLARKALSSIRSGERPDLGENYYYALSLSGASGRIMVRDWMEGRFEELVSSINTWFDDLAIVHREGGREAQSPKFLAVLAATTRDIKDLNAPFVSKMWRGAVRGDPIPLSALANAIIRTRIDIIENEPFNHARMGLIRAYHVRKNRLHGGGSMQETTTRHLNEGHPSPAYQSGRLMAVLASLQRSALGDVGAGVVQRYYAAASSTPALVLGRLTRTSQFHLNKLDPGLAYWYEEKISSIWSGMGDSVPAVLSLEEQSLFALGYYQQIADMRARNKKGDGNKEEGADE